MVSTEEDVNADRDVTVCIASTEQLATGIRNEFFDLQAKKKFRIYSFVYGPYIQHHFLVCCVQKLMKYNEVGAEVKGRLLWVASNHASFVCHVIFQLLWLLSICLPFVCIVLGYVCYDTWLVCSCAMFLCLLISCHSIAIFLVLHNHKFARHLWCINKVDLEHYCGQENSIMEVTLGNPMSMQFMSASQKSQVIRELARAQEKRRMIMICTKSFWTRHIQDPMLCLLLVLIIALIVLIIDLDLIRKHHL